MNPNPIFVIEKTQNLHLLLWNRRQKGEFIMFDKMFKQIARWQLTEHSWDLARRARQERYYRKKGYIV